MASLIIYYVHRKVCKTTIKEATMLLSNIAIIESLKFLNLISRNIISIGLFISSL